MCFTLHCSNKPRQGNYCSKCLMRKWRAKHPINAIYHSVKASAKARGIPFTITLKWFTEWCISTGYLKKRGHEPDSMSIDRIKVVDTEGNIMGYQEGNLQLLTLAENGKKSVQDKKDLWKYRKLENTDDVPF